SRTAKPVSPYILSNRLVSVATALNASPKEVVPPFPKSGGGAAGATGGGKMPEACAIGAGSAAGASGGGWGAGGVGGGGGGRGGGGRRRRGPAPRRPPVRRIARGRGTGRMLAKQRGRELYDSESRCGSPHAHGSK